MLAVPAQDGMGDGRCRGEAIVLVDADVDAVGDQHLQRGPEGGLAQRVRVTTHEERSGVSLLSAVPADGSAGGDDVRLVEGRRQGRSAVPGGAEGDALGWLLGIGHAGVVGIGQSVQVDERRGLSGPTGEFTCHGFLLGSCRSTRVCPAGPARVRRPSMVRHTAGASQVLAGTAAKRVPYGSRSVAQPALTRGRDWRIVGLTGGGRLVPRRMQQEEPIG